MTGYCEHHNSTSVSTKRGECLTGSETKVSQEALWSIKLVS